MNFLENIFGQLSQAASRPVLQEVREGRLVAATGGELLALVGAARTFLIQAGLRRGDRCALLAHNSIRWVAVDLAIMAEGIIVVPLYARQAPAELAAMIKDCSASLVCCGDASLRDAITQAWPKAPRRALFDEVLARASSAGESGASPVTLTPSDPVAIIYTSGTAGEAKGVILTVGNLNHMLACTTARLDLLMGPRRELDRVFHYLPFCFAGSWILLLSCLSRSSVLTLSTDLARLADEIRLAEPNYFLNVPALLERIRTGVEQELTRRGGIALSLFEMARAAWFRRQTDQRRLFDSMWLALANAVVFPAIRKRLVPNLKALICGSAPLAKETQLFFMMLGVPVLQVYGLTETTAICTLDDPRRIEAGRVGPAIPGIEMKLGADEEILVRGPNIFAGYWNRPEETAQAMRDGWFRTGDLGNLSDAGAWGIIGRLKNLIILNTGHNVAPEPIEESLLRSLPGAQQVVVVGNGKSYLGALVTGEVTREQVEAQIAAVNPQLPHYKHIRAVHIERDPFTIEGGLLTANGKLKRDAIAARYQAQIEQMYHRKDA
ncbi:MAG: AMP-binding protein [Candidatus Acidiferrales bacterium]